MYVYVNVCSCVADLRLVTDFDRLREHMLEYGWVLEVCWLRTGEILLSWFSHDAVAYIPGLLDANVTAAAAGAAAVTGCYPVPSDSWKTLRCAAEGSEPQILHLGGGGPARPPQARLHSRQNVRGCCHQLEAAMPCCAWSYAPCE